MNELLRTMVKIRRAFATRGAQGTARLIVARLMMHGPRSCSPKPCAFDLRYGTETSGTVDQIDLDTHRFSSWIHGTRYQAAGERLLATLVAATNVKPDDYTFIDLGSGKGRMVLAAAEAGFRRSIGVEFSKSLVGIAEKNAIAFREHFGACNIEFRCCDASDFDYPSGPLVVFLYHPFGEPVMRAVVRAIAACRRSSDEPLWVWYHNPQLKKCWDEAGFQRYLDLPELDTIIWRLEKKAVR